MIFGELDPKHFLGVDAVWVLSSSVVVPKV